MHLQGRERTSKAAIYPEKLCEAIVKGILKQQAYEKKKTVASPDMGRNEIKSMIKKICQISGKSLSSLMMKSDLRKRFDPKVGGCLDGLVTGDMHETKG